MTTHSTNPPSQGSGANSKDAAAAEAEQFFRLWNQKTNALVASGLREGHARGLAQLELRISGWPPEWGNDLRILIYGDFDTPLGELEFPNLGITIDPINLTKSFITSAMCVVAARVSVSEKSVSGLADATARIDTLLGVLAALDWGNSGSGWWSHITHGSIAGSAPRLERDRARNVVDALQKLPVPVAQKVRAALYWIREPRLLLKERHRSDVLRVYSGYWNAFECLVEAICLLRPQPKAGQGEKQAKIDAFFATTDRKLDAASISECYNEIVNPSFVAKATYALAVCFPDSVDRYGMECFRMKPEQDRSYNIRNAINHGAVDAGNPSELLRVEDRHKRLWMIVFGMLGSLVPIDRPLDHDGQTGVQ